MGVLGRLWGVLGRPWGVFGAPWGVFGASWGVFGASWGPKKVMSIIERGATGLVSEALGPPKASKMLRPKELRGKFAKGEVLRI